MGRDKEGKSERVTYPALIADSLWAFTTDANTNDMGGRVEQAHAQVDQLFISHLLDKRVYLHGRDELLVADSGAIGKHDGLTGSINLGDLAMLAESSVFLGQGVCDCNPYAAGATAGGEAECRVGTPVAGGLLQDDVSGHSLEIWRRDTLAKPGALHLIAVSGTQMLFFLLKPRYKEGAASSTHLSRRHSPDLEVIRAHEQIGNATPHHAENPLIEVLGLCVGHAGFQGGIDHAIQAFDLVLLGQHGDVVLERVGHPEALAADIGNALVGVPVVVLGQGLIDAIVEVFVVGEDYMTANIV